MNKVVILFLGLAVFLSLTVPSSYGAQTIVAQKVDKGPVIDGAGNDPVWEKATAIVTHEKIADVDITLKSVYTDQEIFFLVSFPDPDESREHKTWTWDKNTQRYKIGPEREDCFVFKWNMGIKPVDLSIYANEPYSADIWFWKARRTDATGYADDKIDRLSFDKLPDSREIVNKSGQTMYLQRLGDEGEAPYKDILYSEYKGDKVSHFEYQSPSGSHADIRAKGLWSGGRWTIEFSRALNTGNKDDVQFVPGKIYQFGVSRYEMAARLAEPEATQPLYGCGDVSEKLGLIFSQ